MIPFALTQSDAPNRPDDLDDDLGDETEPSDLDLPADPDPPTEPVHEPEITPGAPERRDVPTPEIPPPDHPETVPPPPEVEPPPEMAQPEPFRPAWSDELEPSEREHAPSYGAEESIPVSLGQTAASPAAARPAGSAPVPTPKPERPPLQRAVLAILLIAAAGMIGYVLSSTDDRPGEPDVLMRSVEAAGNLRLLLRTNEPAEARQFVREEFGWRVGVPVFDAASLTGVAIAQAAPAVEVPVFLYADEEDRNVAVFAYSYALLDQVPDRLRLTGDDYDELAEGAPVIRNTDGGDVLLWRDRDDIYVAVTDLSPDALSGSLSMDR